MNKITKHTLFIGLNDKDTKHPVMTTDAAQAVVSRLLINAGYDATISTATGIYTHSGTQNIVIEQTVRVEILFADEKTTLRLCDELKRILNQESIALQVEQIESRLV